MTEADLTASLARLCEVEETPGLGEKDLRAYLSELADLELIEPITP